MCVTYIVILVVVVALKLL